MILSPLQVKFSHSSWAQVVQNITQKDESFLHVHAKHGTIQYS